MLKGMAMWHWLVIVLAPAAVLALIIVAGIAWCVRDRPFD